MSKLSNYLLSNDDVPSKSDPNIIVFYPHNPFQPHHGSHLRCLQQLDDLSSHYGLILASSYSTSDSLWPGTAYELYGITKRHKIKKIEIFERSILGMTDAFCSSIVRQLNRLVPFLPIVKFRNLIHRTLFLAWFNILIIRYQACASVIHYTHWSYLSNGLSIGLKILELHDLLPVNLYLSHLIAGFLPKNFSHSPSESIHQVEYVERIDQLPANVVAECQKVALQLNRYDLVWMISRREENLLRELGFASQSCVIYPSIYSSSKSPVKTLPPILPVGPNVFNTYSLLRFINEVIPHLLLLLTSSIEIQVTGRFWEDKLVPMPYPLRYYGLVDDYSHRLALSSFMIAPTLVGTGQQIKIFEALSSGVPIVAYRCSVPSDVLADYPSIICVDTSIEFAMAISQLLANKDLLQHYTDVASEVAERMSQTRLLYPYSFSLNQALLAHKHKYSLRTSLAVE